MKITHYSLVCLLFGMSVTANASSIERLVSPASLGQTIISLNKIYSLGVKKQGNAYINGKKAGFYYSAKRGKCSLELMTNKAKKVVSIKVYTNSCGFKTKSNVVFDSRKTASVNLLNQVKLSDVSFYQGCYNCPSRIEILDSLVIKRPQDNFYTEFAIDGYNEELKNYMVKKLSQTNKDMPSNKWEALSWLDTLKNNQALFNKLTQNADFKRKAIATYQLKNKPLSYTIALK